MENSFRAASHRAIEVALLLCFGQIEGHREVANACGFFNGGYAKRNDPSARGSN